MKNPMITYELQNPIVKKIPVIGNSGVTKIVTIRIPIVSDMVGLPTQIGYKEFVEILAKCTNLKKAELEALSIYDFGKISEAFNQLANNPQPKQ